MSDSYLIIAANPLYDNVELFITDDPTLQSDYYKINITDLSQHKSFSKYISELEKLTPEPPLIINYATIKKFYNYILGQDENNNTNEQYFFKFVKRTKDGFEYIDFDCSETIILNRDQYINNYMNGYEFYNNKNFLQSFMYNFLPQSHPPEWYRGYNDAERGFSPEYSV